MNEQSSRYVDTIAINKIIETKLSKVSHLPSNSLFQIIKGDPFQDIENVNIDLQSIEYYECDKKDRLRFKSPIESIYTENNYANVIVYNTQDATGNVIFVHGLYEDNLSIYYYLISMLNKMGLNVYLMILPYHYDRMPKESIFSGEFFWSADVARSQWALKQAVYDLKATYKIIRAKSSLPLCITGFSMGGCVSLLLASVCKEIDKLFIINSVNVISKLTWESSLLVNIKKELSSNGYSFENIKKDLAEFEPLTRQNNYLHKKKVVLAYGLYDQIIPQEDYGHLISNMKFQQVIEYSSGHLNILRVPRLASDIVKVFN